ncbi:hypothetical protein OsJ_31859 [Oryza sativa Japonica Group]|uniref:Uncharacterized protein n=2 Tax=Oryza sativa subsp. japonica TaxID=39947 RepID=A0A8J8YSM0_ORYSJ|nr:hypothetical protein LOC_Os10g33260 [Oryza sativa Japonica Group]EAZ16393.1 hypothetical protein OsJ_31859 [Oryza sativa Japonica Group]
MASSVYTLHTASAAPRAVTIFGILLPSWIPSSSPPQGPSSETSGTAVEENQSLPPDSQASAAPRAATVNGIRLLTANLELALRLPPSRLDAAPRAAAAAGEAFCPDSQAILPYAVAKDTTSTQSRYLLAKDTPATLRPPPSEGTPPSTPEHLSSRT